MNSSHIAQLTQSISQLSLKPGRGDQEKRLVAVLEAIKWKLP